MNLALMYFKLGNYSNPFRISALFSSISVITRDKHIDEGKNEEIKFPHMQSFVKQIVKEKNLQFIKPVFQNAWKLCREERNNIEHGYASNLIDIDKSEEYNSLSNQVYQWAYLTIQYFIDKNQIKTQ